MKDLLIFAVVLLVIDIAWLVLYMGNKYSRFFDSLNLTMNKKMVFAALAYGCMILSYFLIKNKDSNKELLHAFLMGLVIYGTYGFTLATIMPNYTLEFALTEVFWGIILYVVAIKIKQVVVDRL